VRLFRFVLVPLLHDGVKLQWLCLRVCKVQWLCLRVCKVPSDGTVRKRKIHCITHACWIHDCKLLAVGRSTPDACGMRLSTSQNLKNSRPSVTRACQRDLSFFWPNSVLADARHASDAWACGILGAGASLLPILDGRFHEIFAALRAAQSSKSVQRLAYLRVLRSTLMQAQHCNGARRHRRTRAHAHTDSTCSSSYRCAAPSLKSARAALRSSTTRQRSHGWWHGRSGTCPG
jgi:hypothetical protein